MVAKQKTAKKRTRSAAAVKTVTVSADKARIVELRATIKTLREESREKDKAIKLTQRQIKGLMKVIDSTAIDVSRFMSRRVKDAVDQYGIVLVPKKRRRSAAKKTTAAKSVGRPAAKAAAQPEAKTEPKPVAKRRGRPPKATATPEVNPAAQPEAKTAPKPVAKRRGRPPKATATPEVSPVAQPETPPEVAADA